MTCFTTIFTGFCLFLLFSLVISRVLTGIRTFISDMTYLIAFKAFDDILMAISLILSLFRLTLIWTIGWNVALSIANKTNYFSFFLISSFISLLRALRGKMSWFLTYETNIYGILNIILASIFSFECIRSIIGIWCTIICEMSSLLAFETFLIISWLISLLFLLMLSLLIILNLWVRTIFNRMTRLITLKANISIGSIVLSIVIVLPWFIFSLSLLIALNWGIRTIFNRMTRLITLKANVSIGSIVLSIVIVLPWLILSLSLLIIFNLWVRTIFYWMTRLIALKANICILSIIVRIVLPLLIVDRSIIDLGKILSWINILSSVTCIMEVSVASWN